MKGTNLLNEISLYFTSKAQSEGSESGLRVVEEEPSLRSSGSDS
jgi:hypothetical protein